MEQSETATHRANIPRLTFEVLGRRNATPSHNANDSQISGLFTLSIAWALQLLAYLLHGSYSLRLMVAHSDYMSDCSRPHCVGLNNNLRYSFPQQHLSY